MHVLPANLRWRVMVVTDSNETKNKVRPNRGTTRFGSSPRSPGERLLVNALTVRSYWSCPLLYTSGRWHESCPLAWGARRCGFPGYGLLREQEEEEMDHEKAVRQELRVVSHNLGGQSDDGGRVTATWALPLALAGVLVAGEPGLCRQRDLWLCGAERGVRNDECSDRPTVSLGGIAGAPPVASRLGGGSGGSRQALRLPVPTSSGLTAGGDQGGVGL